VLPFGARLANATIAYVWYVEKTIWPSGLAVLYPHPYLGSAGGPPVGAWLIPSVLLLAVTAGAVWQAARRPYLLVGWLWYVGTLVPVIGLVQVGVQATADRYSYVPLVGPFVAIAWTAAEAAGRETWRRLLVAVVAGLVLVACIAVTREQLVHWRGARALAERSIAVTRDNFVMHFNLGLALQEDGDLQGARWQYEEAVRLAPSQGGFHGNLAVVLVELGRPSEALRSYRTAIELSPGEAGSKNNLAWLLATYPDGSIRDGPEAVTLAEAALRTSAGRDPQVLDTLAAAQAESGDFGSAVDTARRAMRLAREGGRHELAAVIEERARSYADGRPHREGG
jgi:Tfp pilus assembly protein PilF